MRTIRQYATVATFRSITGVTEENEPDISNDMIRQGIVRASEHIDKATGETFLPKKETVHIDGRGENLLYHPSIYPILDITSISINNDKSLSSIGVFALSGGTETLNADTYERTSDHQFVKLLGSNGLSLCTISAFPRGAQNIILDGLFGWMEPEKEYTTMLTTEIKHDSTSLKLNSVDYVEVGDILVFGDMDGGSNDILHWVEVITVDYTTKNITFEAIGRKPGIPLRPFTTAVSCFGRVPFGIVHGTAILAKNRMIPGLVGENFVGNEGIKSMRTDAFFWSRFTSQEQGGGATFSLTGDQYADSLIDGYMRPPYIGSV